MTEPMATYTLSADYGSATIRPQRCDTLYRALLRHPAGLTVPELAQELGWTETQVRPALSRADDVYGVRQMDKRVPPGGVRAQTVYAALTQPRDYGPTTGLVCGTPSPWWRRLGRWLMGRAE